MGAGAKWKIAELVVLLKKGPGSVLVPQRLLCGRGYHLPSLPLEVREAELCVPGRKSQTKKALNRRDFFCPKL